MVTGIAAAAAFAIYESQTFGTRAWAAFPAHIKLVPVEGNPFAGAQNR
jgi:hypothetical protein